MHAVSISPYRHLRFQSPLLYMLDVHYKLIYKKMFKTAMLENAQCLASLRKNMILVPLVIGTRIIFFLRKQAPVKMLTTTPMEGEMNIVK